MPYVVPEGYFSELEERLGAIPRRNVAVSRFDKLKPYVALAAAFLIIVTCGTVLLRFTSGQAADSNLSMFDEIALADLIPVTDPYMIYTAKENDETQDAFASYLIDSGITLDYIGYYEDNR